MRHPTGSALPRVFECPASHVLPQARCGGQWANYGQSIHAFRVAARAVGRDAALAAIPEDATHRDLCEQLDLARFPARSRLEVALAWNQDTDTAAILGDNIDRAYPAEYLSAPWWTGTADEMAEITDDGERAAFVDDLKTGWRAQGAAEQHRQLRFLALAAARALGVDRAVIMWITPRDDGRLFCQRATLDGFDLDAIRDEHRALSRHLADLTERHQSGERLPVTEGDHCTYCPAFAACWAKSAMVIDALAVADPAVVELARLAETPEGRATIGALYARSREQRRILEERLEPAIRGLAANLDGGIPLPDGTVLAEVEVANKPRLVPGLVGPALRRLYPEHPEIADAAVKQEPRATLTTIEEGLRLVAKPGQLARMKTETREALRSEGAIVEGTHREVKPVTQKRLTGTR